MAFTTEQFEAINSRNENLLLAAAAGSGKTTVMVERVLRLIREGADIGSMLIVTFTRSAAADCEVSRRWRGMSARSALSASVSSPTAMPVETSAPVASSFRA